MLIVRYSEIGLKGKNRAFFEKKLVSNIKSCLKSNKIPFTRVTKPRGRILIHTDKECPELKCVFGLSSFSNTTKFESYDELKQSILKYTKKITSKKSFSVRTQRIDKSFKKSSQEVNMELGSLIQEATKAKVNLSAPDITVGIEIIENNFYLYTGSIAGYAGLPLGSEGKVYALIEDKPSLLAAWLVMKRGCVIQPVAFKKIDLGFLKKFSYGQKLELKIIKSLEYLDQPFALIVNHTLSNYKKLETTRLVLRPLITFTDAEIEERISSLK